MCYITLCKNMISLRVWICWRRSKSFHAVWRLAVFNVKKKNNHMDLGEDLWQRWFIFSSLCTIRWILSSVTVDFQPSASDTENIKRTHRHPIKFLVICILITSLSFWLCLSYPLFTFLKVSISWRIWHYCENVAQSPTCFDYECIVSYYTSMASIHPWSFIFCWLIRRVLHLPFKIYKICNLPQFTVFWGSRLRLL